MLIYEVNLHVEAAIFDPFMAWLNPHVEAMLGMAGFIKAMVCLDEDTSQEGRKIVVHYYLTSMEDYQHYLDCHAPRMRQDGLDRFGQQFTASRRLLTVHHTYPPGLGLDDSK